MEITGGIPAEYAAAARRYFGEEQAPAWVGQVGQALPDTARIAVRPGWIRIIDFQTRFPSALAKLLLQNR